MPFKKLALALSLLLLGCDQSDPKQAAGDQPPPSVVTHAVQIKDVSSIIEYVGRSEASQRVDIRARVSGTLLERHFTEGFPTEAGDLLFTIDPAEFIANRASARADVAKAEASVEETSNNLERYTELVKKDVASRAKYDMAKARFSTALAELDSAKASLQRAELDLSYTKIATPFSGRAGRTLVDAGNLIGPDTGVLVTVIKLDPIHILFSVSEREYLDYSARRNSSDGPVMKPQIRLANDEIYPHDGTFDLIDNEVNAATGSINIRVTFPNPDKLLLPGQFVNVLLISKEPQEQVIVPQASVQENQTGPFVLLVDAENRVAIRPIKTGQRVGADIVVTEGLDVGETIIVEGIQKVRPGAVVAPTPADATASAAPARQ